MLPAQWEPRMQRNVERKPSRRMGGPSRSQGGLRRAAYKSVFPPPPSAKIQAFLTSDICGHSSLLHQCPGSLTWSPFLDQLRCTVGMHNRGGWGSRESTASHQKASGVVPGPTRASQGLFACLHAQALPSRAGRPVRSGSDQRMSYR